MNLHEKIPEPESCRMIAGKKYKVVNTNPDNFSVEWGDVNKIFFPDFPLNDCYDAELIAYAKEHWNEGLTEPDPYTCEMNPYRAVWFK